MTQPKLTLPKPGAYIIAVSGGVDSVVLLDLLAAHGEYGLIVATLDHGWREDNALDTQLVECLCAEYGLPFVVARLLLPDRSEAIARKYRYAFLHQLARDYKADGILLAHHADDIRETVILNAQRGADRLGLVPMREEGLLVRPLRWASKQDIVSYAKANGLRWREDSTNTDGRYRRNALRLSGIPALSQDALIELDQAVDELASISPDIDHLVGADIDALGLNWLDPSVVISVDWLRSYSLPVRRHVLVEAMRRLAPYIQLRREQVEQLALAIGSGAKHSHFRLGVALSATLQRDKLILTRGQSAPVQ